MKETDAAYLAGLIDGEGSITIGLRKPCTQKREKSQRYALAVSMSLCGEGGAGLLRWAQQITGAGKIYLERRSNKNPRHRDAWLWQLSPRQAYGVLKEIRPYLRLKGSQADLFMEMIDLRRQSWDHRSQFEPERQLAIAKNIQILNKRGT